MWGGHSYPPLLTWIFVFTASNLLSGTLPLRTPKAHFKSGGQECPPHRGTVRVGELR